MHAHFQAVVRSTAKYKKPLLKLPTLSIDHDLIDYFQVNNDFEPTQIGYKELLWVILNI